MIWVFVCCWIMLTAFNFLGLAVCVCSRKHRKLPPAVAKTSESWSSLGGLMWALQFAFRWNRKSFTMCVNCQLQQQDVIGGRTWRYISKNIIIVLVLPWMHVCLRYGRSGEKSYLQQVPSKGAAEDSDESKWDHYMIQYLYVVVSHWQVFLLTIETR